MYLHDYLRLRLRLQLKKAGSAAPVCATHIPEPLIRRFPTVSPLQRAESLENTKHGMLFA